MKITITFEGGLDRFDRDRALDRAVEEARSLLRIEHIIVATKTVFEENSSKILGVVEIKESDE